jgi:hypothetical protein
MGDINQQILFVECLDSRLGRYSGDDLEGRRCDVDACDEDASVKVVARKILRERTHMFDTDVVSFQELDPDWADIRWRWVGIRLCDRSRVALHHGIARIRRELHVGLAVKVSSLEFVT